jgi:4'-phosphopantetheinyl transferase
VLERDEIHVFLARPDVLDAPGATEAALALLLPEERERVARFHFERDRRLHLCARALLRRSLSACDGGVAPEAWRFAAAREGGRPEIVAPASPLRFSVSHTAGLALVAVGVGRDIGADAERIRAEVPEDVVARTFTAAERAALAATPAAGRSERFTAIWTLKEAYAKALGLGLAFDLDRIGFELGPPRIAEGADAASWHLECSAPTAEHRAAVCARTGGEVLRVSVRSLGARGAA